MAGILKETKNVKKYWLEPESRTVEPVALMSTTVTGKQIGEIPYSARAGLELRAWTTGIECILVDFGKEVGGYPRLTFGSGNCRRIGVQAVESREHLLKPGLAEAAAPADPALYCHRIKTRSDRPVELPHCGGFRYLWLYPECPGRITLRDVWVEYTPYLAGGPGDCGYFLSSDETLNRAWFAGLHTIEMCTVRPTLGGPDGNHRIGEGDWVLVDGAKRDRLIWTADIGPMGAAVYVSDNNADAVRDSLLSLVSRQEQTGYIPGCSQTTVTGRIASGFFGEYVAWWVVCLYQYYMHTGDRELVEELFPAVKRALHYLHSQCRGGLFRQTPLNMMEWCFTVLRRGRPSYTNVMYYWALNSAAYLANEIRQDEVSAGYVSRAFRLSEAIERALWDEGRGVFLDTTADRNRVPQDANSLAIVSGMVGEPSAQRTILEYIREHMWTEYGSTNVDVPYYRLTPGLEPHNKRVIPFMNNYEALARFAARDDSGAMELIRRCWGDMVDREPGSTFWEWKGRSGGVDNHISSLCHGWSAGVVPLLSKYVLGVRPAAAGYRRFRFEPRLCDLDWAEGRVPVPGGGFIEARVVKVKGGIEASVKAPKGFEQQTGGKKVRP